MVQHAAELHGVPVKEVIDTVLDEDEEDEDFDDEDSLDDAPKRHVGAWITTLVIGCLFGLGIVFLIHWAEESDTSGPATTTVQAAEQSLEPTPTPAALPSITSKYITFSYPSLFNTVREEQNIPNSEERYIIESTADYRREIAVEVEGNTPTVGDDSGYQYRTLNPSLYQPEDTKVDGEPAVIMVGTDGTERTLYWAHAGSVVIISLTDTTGADNLAAFMDTIVGSLRWLAS